MEILKYFAEDEKVFAIKQVRVGASDRFKYSFVSSHGLVYELDTEASEEWFKGLFSNGFHSRLTRSIKLHCVGQLSDSDLNILKYAVEKCSKSELEFVSDTESGLFISSEASYYIIPNSSWCEPVFIGTIGMACIVPSDEKLRSILGMF